MKKDNYQNLSFSVYDLFKNISINLKVIILQVLFGYNQSIQLKFDKIQNHDFNKDMYFLNTIYSNLKSYCCKLELLNMSEVTKNYFNLHLSNFNILYYLRENVISPYDSRDELNNYILDCIFNQKELNFYITIEAIHKIKQNSFQPYHKIKVLLNNKNILPLIEKTCQNFFYYFSEDFGDGVIDIKKGILTSIHI